MTPYRNLISESLLIDETIALLHLNGGRASAMHVVDRVMNIRRPDPILAKNIVLDLVDRDPRLELIDDVVELVQSDNEHQGLFETDFVVFDLETTGAKAPPCRVTEIGAYRVAGGCVTDEFHSLINPQVPIPPFITALTGIDDEMVNHAPVFAEIIDELMDFIGDSVLVAHNAAFDMRFLNNEIRLIFGEYRLANPCLCTVQLSRRLLPDIENHKLKTVAQYYSISLVNHHRAGDDARATAEIFLNLLGLMTAAGISDIGSIHRLGLRRRTYGRRR
jgi:DNA polymerase-3 subunit alpha (Gram-positive type)